MAINAQELQGQWNQLKGKVKEKWGQLTDDDLNVSGGNFDQVIGKIQQRVGIGREEVEKFFGTLTEKGGSAVAQATEKVRDYAQQAGERFKDNYGQASEYARQQYEQAEDLVRSKPAQSVAAAFGIGIVVGLVVGIAVRGR